MADQLPSKDQLPNVTLTPEQEARANVMADQMSASYWGYRSSARWIVHLLDQVATTTGEAAALERKLDTCGLECSSTLKSLVAENERLRTCLTGISTCSTCEACRGAAKRALGGAAPEPPAELARWLRQEARVWRDDAFENAALICERYEAHDAARDIRHLKGSAQPPESGPASLVGALQDKVHRDLGPVRAGRSRPSQPPAEPDWKHPKLQALLASEARLKIERDMIAALIDDPKAELYGLSDYETELTEKLRDRAAQPPGGGQ